MKASLRMDLKTGKVDRFSKAETYMTGYGFQGKWTALVSIYLALVTSTKVNSRKAKSKASGR